MSLRSPRGRPPDVDFVRVPDEKHTKNRIHLDVAPFADDDSLPAARPDRDEEVARLISAGATHADVGQHDDPETTWVVLADPEGNEFCVLAPR